MFSALHPTAYNVHIEVCIQTNEKKVRRLFLRLITHSSIDYDRIIVTCLMCFAFNQGWTINGGKGTHGPYQDTLLQKNRRTIEGSFAHWNIFLKGKKTCQGLCTHRLTFSGPDCIFLIVTIDLRRVCDSSVAIVAAKSSWWMVLKKASVRVFQCMYVTADTFARCNDAILGIVNQNSVA